MPRRLGPILFPFLRLRVPRLGRGFDAEAKVERNDIG